MSDQVFRFAVVIFLALILLALLLRPNRRYELGQGGTVSDTHTGTVWTVDGRKFTLGQSQMSGTAAPTM